MKRLLAPLALALLLSAPLLGCGKKGDLELPPAEPTSEGTTP